MSEFNMKIWKAFADARRPFIDTKDDTTVSINFDWHSITEEQAIQSLDGDDDDDEEF